MFDTAFSVGLLSALAFVLFGEVGSFFVAWWSRFTDRAAHSSTVVELQTDSGSGLAFFRFLLGSEFFNVSLKLVDSCPALQIQANHFNRAFVGRAAGVDQNQQASDDRHLSLNFDTVLLRAE